MATTPYYIIRNGVQIGPLSEDQLLSQGITESTPVWRKGMPQWATADQVPELAGILANTPPDYQAFEAQQPVVEQPVRQENETEYDEAPDENSHLGFAILVCVLSGVVGVPALLFAIFSKVAYGRKQYDRSRSLGNASLICCIVGLVLAIFVWGSLFKDCSFQ